MRPDAAALIKDPLTVKNGAPSDTDIGAPPFMTGHFRFFLFLALQFPDPAVYSSAVYSSRSRESKDILPIFPILIFYEGYRSHRLP